MDHDPVTVCYCATLIFLCAVLAAIVFAPRDVVLTLFMKNTLRTYVVVVTLAMAAGALGVLLWSRLGRAGAP